MVPNWAMRRQYFLASYQFSYWISTMKLTCLPQPEAACFRFESSGAADI